MCSIFNKNAILTGPVDSLCLACEDHLRGDEDAVQHITKPIHKKNLEAASFFEKYKDDHIRKVKKGYFCEYCNVFLKTSAKVGPHVTEARHRERKASQPLKREGNSIVAFEKVFIPENAWHGFTEDTCCVCDAEFDNALLHKTGTAHILNLVLAEIEIADGNVYRKVDDSTFQCLTCNVIWAIKDMPAHFDGADHKDLYQKCCSPAENLNKPIKETPDSAKEVNQIQKPKEEIPIYETSKKEPPVAVNKDSNGTKSEKEASKNAQEEIPTEVKTNKTTDVLNVKTNDCEIKPETDMKPEPKKIKKAASDAANLDNMSKTDKEICEALGADNYVASNVNGGQWCILCDWAIDEKSVQKHIKSKHHLTILEMHREREAKNNSEIGKGTNDNNDDESKSKEKHDESSIKEQKAKSNSKIVDAADEFQKNNIKLDMINGSAYCRDCLKNIDYDFDIIKNHIDEHKNAPKPEKIKKTEILKSFTNSADKKSISLVTSPVLINLNADKSKHEEDEETKQGENIESKQDNTKESKQEKNIESKQDKDKESEQDKDKVSKQDKDKESKQDKDRESIQDKDKESKQNKEKESKQDKESKLDKNKEFKQDKTKESKQDKDKDSKQNKNKVSKQDKNKESKQDKDKESKQNKEIASKQSTKKESKKYTNKLSKLDKDKEPSQGSDKETVKYAKDNNLVFNKEANTAFCSICQTKIPPALKNMKEHINGVGHKNKIGQLKFKPVKHVMTKVSSHTFIDNAVVIENFNFKDVVINGKYCLNIFSFLMMTKLGKQLRCQGCEMNLEPTQVESHRSTPRHENVMNEALVLSSEQSEFIRESRPNVYHCGFCNQLESPWSSMEKHLQSTAHREAKTSAFWRLKSHLPGIALHRKREAMQYMMFARMMQMLNI